MTVQLTLRASAPPALPMLLQQPQNEFAFDDQKVGFTELEVTDRKRMARTARARRRTRSSYLGRDPVLVTIRAQAYVPRWRAQISDNFLRGTPSEDRLLYPLRRWYEAGNKVRFVTNGYTYIPPGEYEITRIESRNPLHWHGGVWLARWYMEFEGGL